MDAHDVKTARAYARTRSLARETPKAIRAELNHARMTRLAKGYGAGKDRAHNVGKLAKHDGPSPTTSLVLAPVMPAQPIEPLALFADDHAPVLRELKLSEVPVKVKRHKRGVSDGYEVVAPLRRVIVLDDGIEEQQGAEDDDDDDWERLEVDGDEAEAEAAREVVKMSYAAAVKA